MKSDTWGQLKVFGLLLAVNALLAAVSYLLLPMEQLAAPPGGTMPAQDIPTWVFGLANACIILVVYGLLGLAGYRLARRLGLPGIFREDAGWREWAFVPMLIGFGVGAVIIAVDVIFAAADPNWDGFAHPAFPLSIVASATAGIGEEVLFRLFVMSLWAFLTNLVLRRFGATGIALWTGNVMGALAFSAGHLPTAMITIGVSSPTEIPSLVLAELFILNSVIGLVAGWQFMRVGLVAAVGVHFWADILWHVLWPIV